MMKVRNLQQSHDYREYKQKNPTRAFYTRRRVYLPASAPPQNHDDTIIPEKPQIAKASSNKDAYDEEIDKMQPKRQQIRQWVEERRVQRKDINKLGLDASWLLNKSQKTECENRVYDRMMNINRNGISDSEKENEALLMAKRNTRRLSSAHVDFLPYVKSPLPIALALIADYLMDNRLRLIDLFSKVDKNKDWKMTRDELKIAFQRIDIPLSEGQLDHLIFTLDADNDNELSYKEVARGIENYNRDRRWQKMKQMYDNMVAETIDEKIESTDLTDLSDKAKSDLMHLQNYEGFRQTPKNNRRTNERQREAKTTTKDDIFFTTMTGSMVDKRIEYLKFIDKECQNCIDYLNDSGMFVPKETLKQFYRAPTENAETDCIAYLSSVRSAFPFAHALNVSYRKNQRKFLKRMARQEANTANRIDKSPEENEVGQALTAKKHFLPRVALFKEIPREGRRKRRQIENAPPSPVWPQHLLDKLCLCMDKCHTGKDRKEVMFNLVKP